MARRHPSASAPMTMISLTTGFTAISAGLQLIFSSTLLLQAQGGAISRSEDSSSYVPVRRVVYRSMSMPPAAMTTTAEAAASAAPYEPFEVCEECRCCSSSSSGNGSSCVDTSCCYAIDCNLPGKPFGTCAFTPQSCGCGAANNCTQPAS